MYAIDEIVPFNGMNVVTLYTLGGKMLKLIQLDKTEINNSNIYLGCIVKWVEQKMFKKK